MIYLDNAATTFPKPESVYREMDRVNRNLAINSGRGSYKAAKEAAQLIDETKSRLLGLFHAEGLADICFCPSVTHAINQVVAGLNLNEYSVVYLTPYEHNAVARTVHYWQKKLGFSVELMPLTEELRIDTDRLIFQFTQRKPTLVIANNVSNVTGYVLPVEDVFHAAKKYGAITVMDAAQAAGLCEINLQKIEADIVCFAGHKSLYGPFGIGGFVLRSGIKLSPVLTGGTGSDSLNLDMPDNAPTRYEASSPNIIAIAGLNAALKNLNQEEHLRQVSKMTEYLISKLETLDNVQMLGTYEAGKTLGAVSIVVDGYSSEDVGNILDDEFDIAVRTGYHCAPYIHDYLRDKEYGGTVRISVGLFTEREDIDCLIDALETL